MAHVIINGGPDHVAGHGGVRRDQYLESSCISSLAVTIAKSQRLGNLQRKKSPLNLQFCRTRPSGRSLLSDIVTRGKGNITRQEIRTFLGSGSQVTTRSHRTEIISQNQHCAPQRAHGSHEG